MLLRRRAMRLRQIMSPPVLKLSARHLRIDLLASSFSNAAVERFGVVIGNNVGAPEDQELRYAETDASKMCETLKSLGGFSPADSSCSKARTPKP